MPIERPAVAMLARSPFAPGKTRLTGHLDAPTAQALRVALLLDAIEAALAPGWPLHLYLEPPDHVLAVHALLQCDPALADVADDVHLHPQGTGDLGARISDGMRRTLAAGHDAVVLTGSDSPDLPDEALLDAIDALEDDAAGSRLVLGPAGDGGIYLVAATRADGAAFEGVTWSQPTVLDALVARAQAVGRDVVLVQPWHDVDTFDDLARLLDGDEGAAPRTTQLARTLPPYNQAS
jgi:glycosyltransferase A (GT-A) superfamily protein (DUF2064 family)